MHPRKSYTTTVIALVLLMLVGASITMAAPAQPDTAAPIRLRAGTFTPGLGQTLALPDGLALDRYDADQAGYYLVQFRGPVQQTWKDQVAATGATLLDYIPEFAFKVRMTPAQAETVQGLAAVAWTGIFQPFYKLNPNLIRDGVRLYTVQVEEGADLTTASDRILAESEVVLSRTGNRFLVAANPAQITALARILDVSWIDNFQLRERHNEYGGGVILGGSIANANGYDGSTQIVAVADTGLGGGTTTTAHRDIPSSRIVAIYDWPGADNGNCWTAVNDGPKDVDSGHGTHTSASVLSDGGPSGEGKGTAPAARLVFQAVEDYADMKGFCAYLYGDGYYLLGLPDDLRDLLGQAYNAGARIHSDSWGSSVSGEYTDDAANADDFTWTHPDFLMTTSAGNAGVDANSDGYADLDSMGSPATAKNVLAVGASEDDRQAHYECDAGLSYTTCASQGGQNQIFTYGEAWPSDYPANPLSGDLAAGNAEQMAAFSSRGPADDGRIKPDVVAPGTYVMSAYADLYQQGYDSTPNPQNNAWQYDGWGFPFDQYYKYMGGTSMSNPLTAGAAAVVRDYFQKAQGHNASAALTKAMLINSAVDMLDENNDGANDNDYPIPNNHEGWGRVNVAAATDGSRQFVDETAGLSTNESRTYQFNIASSGAPFKVSLVWSDYRGSTTASKALVNDLDLVVTAPGGALYRGNVFSGGWSQAGGSADRTNNVENVYVQAASAGTWTVEVQGYNVPNGPQPFALVVAGSTGAGPTPTNTTVPPTATPTNTPVPPTATPTNTPVPPTATPTNTPVGPTPTSTTVPPTATPTNTTVPPTATPTPVSSGTLHVGDLDGSGDIVFGNLWRATVTITVHDTAHNPVANATVNGAWSSGASGTGQCTTGSNGQCNVVSSNLFRRSSSATFTVNGITHSTLSYNAGDNHDPDGDSNGTAITVQRPY